MNKYTGSCLPAFFLSSWYKFTLYSSKWWNCLSSYYNTFSCYLFILLYQGQKVMLFMLAYPKGHAWKSMTLESAGIKGAKSFDPNVMIYKLGRNSLPAYCSVHYWIIHLIIPFSADFDKFFPWHMIPLTFLICIQLKQATFYSFMFHASTNTI